MPRASQDVADQVAGRSGQVCRGGAEPSPRRSASSPSAPETASQEPPSRPDGASGEGPGGPGHRVLLKRRFSTSGERDALTPVPLPLGPLGTAAATEPPSRARPPSLHVLPLPGDARPEDSGARGAGGSPRASPPPASRNRPPQGDRPARPPREAGLEPHGVRKCPHPRVASRCPWPPLHPGIPGGDGGRLCRGPRGPRLRADPAHLGRPRRAEPGRPRHRPLCPPRPPPVPSTPSPPQHPERSRVFVSVFFVLFSLL